MRNVAFSILLFALALMQIAVVSTELPHAHAQTPAVKHVESGARIVLASSETEHKAQTF